MADVAYFVEHYKARRKEWQSELAALKAADKRVVLWGGGSKGVAFLTTLGLTLDDVRYAVDINPNKTGTFMAGTGQEIVAPEFLKSYQPDVVIIMNPIYRTEITHDLATMGLAPDIRTV
jgi:ABC-type Fe3+-hydroxamate transport system substrate-binding protein